MEKNEEKLIDVELEKLYALWLREFKVFLREKSRLGASIFTPLLWLFVFGGGLGSSITNFSSSSNIGYQEFIFPGILCMSVIFISVFLDHILYGTKNLIFLKA
ncbi:MAG TPA: ABC transporter permease [Nitrososphaeraceae archaeon]|nr:ABC transporter permease [Nitrososphaeraceae archaeon]